LPHLYQLGVGGWDITDEAIELLCRYDQGQAEENVEHRKR
jgi:hypothetical protein